MRLPVVAVVVAVTAMVSTASVASAQTAAAEGQIVVQAPPPGVVTVAPAPITSACPAGTTARISVTGQPTCGLESPVHRVYAGILGGGIAVWNAGWVTSLVVSAAFAAIGGYGGFIPGEFAAVGVIPFVGPIVQMGYGIFSPGGYAYAVIDSLVQIGGLVMAILGGLGTDVVEWRPAPGYALRLTPSGGELRF